MIGNDGKSQTREQLRAHIAVYNQGQRGSKEFGNIPRALITILDGLKPGKTGYVKGSDGQMQLVRKKDGTVAC